MVNLEEVRFKASPLQSEMWHQGTQVSTHQAASLARETCSLAQGNLRAQSSCPLQLNCVHRLIPPVQMWHDLLMAWLALALN